MQNSKCMHSLSTDMPLNREAQRNMDQDVEENEALYEAFAATPEDEE